MKAVKRFGLIILFLFLGTLIGQLGTSIRIIIFSGLFIIWFMLWDERKYDQETAQATKVQPDPEINEQSDYFLDDFYYVEHMNSRH